MNHSVARIFKKFERVKNLNDENLKSASLANGQAQSRKISKKLRLILVGYYIVYLLFLFLNDFGVWTGNEKNLIVQFRRFVPLKARDD